MDFETRQKLAVEEINRVLAKFSLGLNAKLDISGTAIVPRIIFTDVVAEPKQDEKETKPNKANKTKKGKK